jgi:SH3 domain protein
MKFLVLAFLPIILGAQISYGDTRYVTEDLAVMARTSPNPRSKIIGMPKSGTPLEILEVQDEGWSRVTLRNGKEGWVLSRFLAPGPPSRDVIERLRRENGNLERRTSFLSEENTGLKKKRDELEKAVLELTDTAGNLKTAYETLKHDSSGYLSLKASYESAILELSSKTKQVGDLEEKAEEISKDRSLKWFLAGSSVILAGFILGLIYRKPKRHSYLR